MTGFGSAPTNAADFVGGVLPSGVVTFANSSEITKTITINVNGDTNFENDESFRVTLSNPSTLMAITQAAVTSIVMNDDQPQNSDLIVDSITPPVAALSGQTVTLKWVEKNAGAASAIGTWSTLVQVINRTTGQFVVSRTPIFTSNVLTPQSSVERSIQFDLPNGVPGEGNYDINIRSTPVRVSSKPTPPTLVNPITRTRPVLWSGQACILTSQ